jgi:hypothetical protein
MVLAKDVFRIAKEKLDEIGPLVKCDKFLAFKLGDEGPFHSNREFVQP